MNGLRRTSNLMSLACLTIAWFPALASSQVSFPSGFARKICQVTGETDREFNQPTASQTESRYGLVGADLGYSFEHHGKLFFLFGDADPAATFKGKKNGPTDSPRVADDNDAIGYTTDTTVGQGLKVDFTLNSIGAYKNPLVLDSTGHPAIRLRTNEMPIAGISINGRMYVIFGTDNPYANPTHPGDTVNLGAGPTRTVMAVSDDDANSFHYLYDLSKGDGARFIYDAICLGTDGYVYIWGAQGGLQFRHSALYLARKPVAQIDSPQGTEYYHVSQPDGTPLFSTSESDATPLFVDYDGPTYLPLNSTAHHGVEWNRFIKKWVLIYDCTNSTPANLSGIYLRLADHPWGPWSPPQTIFNARRDSGICRFIHRAITPSQPQCDGLAPNRPTEEGGNYAPYILSRFTVGDSLHLTSTFYWTMATWNPYTQDVMRTTIQLQPQSSVATAPTTGSSSFELLQNYPDPFNPSTTIPFRIPIRSFVTLTIFNSLGQVVAELIRGEMDGGYHEVHFNASGLASGVYIYRLQAGNVLLARSLLVLR